MKSGTKQFYPLTMKQWCFASSNKHTFINWLVFLVKYLERFNTFERKMFLKRREIGNLDCSDHIHEPHNRPSGQIQFRNRSGTWVPLMSQPKQEIRSPCTLCSFLPVWISLSSILRRSDVLTRPRVSILLFEPPAIIPPKCACRIRRNPNYNYEVARSANVYVTIV